ncbi:MAG: hypothetical protein JWN03_1232 [Nocardia sp.]|nr:hypothetical protein [Nocardia sp.]
MVAIFVTPGLTCGFGNLHASRQRVRRARPATRTKTQSDLTKTQLDLDGASPKTAVGPIRIPDRAYCLWAKGDLNPHILSDTGT